MPAVQFSGGVMFFLSLKSAIIVTSFICYQQSYWVFLKGPYFSPQIS